MVWRSEVPNVSRWVKDKACHVKDSQALQPAPLAETLALPLSSVPLPCQPHRGGAGPDTESGQRETEATSRPLLQRLQALCPPQPPTCSVHPPVGAPSLSALERPARPANWDVKSTGPQGVSPLRSSAASWNLPGAGTEKSKATASLGWNLRKRPVLPSPFSFPSSPFLPSPHAPPPSLPQTQKQSQARGLTTGCKAGLVPAITQLKVEPSGSLSMVQSADVQS